MLVFIMLLAGCSGREAKIKNPAEPSAVSENEVPKAENAVNADVEENEIFYPLSGRTAWLDGGRTLAVQEGFKIRYINTENELINEIELSAESLPYASDCVFSNHGIFMGIEDDYSEGSENRAGTSICRVGGEWKLYGGAFFDREGNIVRELPYIVEKYTEDDWNTCKAVLSTGETIDYYKDALPIMQSLWIGEDVMAFFYNRSLFFYRISEDRLCLSVDFSDAMPDDKFVNAYYGIEAAAPLNGGAAVVYSDYENGGTRLLFADENGYKDIFDENISNYYRVWNGKIIVIDIIENEMTFKYLNEDFELSEFASIKGFGFDGGLSRNREPADAPERIDFTAGDDRSVEAFYSFDFATGILSSYVPPEYISEGNDIRDVIVCEDENGKLIWYYQIFIDGKEYYRIYSEATGIDKFLYSQEYQGEREPLSSTPDGKFIAEKNGDFVRVISLEKLAEE